MQILARKEQELIALTFEKDYGKLIMESNMGIEKPFLEKRAKELLSQIKRTAVPSYFEEDVLDFLSTISRNLTLVVMH